MEVRAGKRIVGMRVEEMLDGEGGDRDLRPCRYGTGR